MINALTTLGQTTTDSISVIEFFGPAKVSFEQIKKELHLKEYGPLRESLQQIEERLKNIPGIKNVSVTTICCENNKPILYIGISDMASNSFTYSPQQTGQVVLPEKIITSYDAFMKAVRNAVLLNDTDDDVSQGHSLLTNKEARAYQEQFIRDAGEHFDQFKNVLHNASDPHQRAVAAYIIGYYQDKSAVAIELLKAIYDSDESVRNNAMRNIGAIIAYSNKYPELKVQIPVEPFITMIHSVIWTDVNKAGMVLLNLSESRDPVILNRIKQGALVPLKQIADWKVVMHALIARLILGRIAGIPDEKIFEYATTNYNFWKEM